LLKVSIRQLIVAEAFIENPKGLPEVNHIDGNKCNNDISNLEWCSRQENITHAWATGLSTREMNKGKGMTLYLGTCVKTGEVLEVESKQALTALGFNAVNVIRCCNGERKVHKGRTRTKIKSPDRV
jgi:hypothetical protein